jgi:type VI secretion system protein ImpK
MSDPNSGGNKTVFRPSPLQGLKGGGAAQPTAPQQGGGWGAPPSPGGAWGNTQPVPPPPPAQPQWGAPSGGAFQQPQNYGGGTAQDDSGGYGALPTMSRTGQGPQGGAALAPSRLNEDDVPLPTTPRQVRNIMLTEAGPVLALAAAMRAGRARTPMPQFHRQATQAIANFDRAVAAAYPEETRQRAKYALCATIDDIAQNLPGLGTDGAEWARRSMVVSFFHENIGGDRFWQLVDDMLRTPSDNLDIIELYHACLAAGFEGRFRVMPDGRRRLHEIMARLHGALAHVRGLSMIEMSPRWRGENAPMGKLGFWTYIAFAAAAALAFLLVIYIILRLILMSSGEAPATAVASIAPEERLRMSRAGGAVPMPASKQADTLKTFLAPEIQKGEVTIEEDANTVRVRTKVGQLFQSGSDALEPGRAEFFARIGKAIETQPGAVTVEGHADSDRISSLAFPDNMALSQARADKVADIIKAQLKDATRVTSKGMGDAVPIASNKTPEGKAENRRVEVIVPRQY